MVTKGYIEKVVDKNKVIVRCPVYDKIQTATNNNTTNNRFSVCTISGTKINMHIGDVVFVGFEDSNLYNGVVLGYLSKDSETFSYVEISALSLDVSTSAVFPKQTNIGSVPWVDIQNLSGVTSNINEQIQEIKATKQTIETYIEELNSKLDEHTKLIEELINKLNSQKKLIETYIALIGEETDTTEDTLYGRLNSYNNVIDSTNVALGPIPDGTVLSERIDSLEQMCVDLSNGIVDSSPIYSEEESENSMLARAEKMINVPWEAKSTFPKWNSANNNFIKGTTYYGMPYTLFGFGYTYDAWKANSDNNIGITGDVPGYGTRTGPKYGSCCADFVSEVFGLPNHQRSCYGLKVNCPDYLETITGEKAKAQYIQTGDAIVNVGNGHVMWIGGVSGSELTVYEQTPPQAHKITLSTTKNITTDGYIFWGKKYDTIVRPKEALLSLEINRPQSQSQFNGSYEQTSPNAKYQWIYKGFHYNTDLHKMALTEDEYFNNARVFWGLCKKAGWTAEAAAGCWSNTYGESSGNPWAYGVAGSISGGGILGFTPFNNGYNGAGIYDFALDVLGDAEKRWDGDVQVAYVNWCIQRVINHTLYAVFSIRKPESRYWGYTPPDSTRIPKNNFDINTYIKLNKKDYDATATICAKLWLARAGVVDLDFDNGRRRNEDALNFVIDSHSEKAEELYQIFIRM